MLFFAYTALLNSGQNIAEYEAYWLIGVPIISVAAILSFKVVCANQPTKITNKHKENFVILQSIEII